MPGGEGYEALRDYVIQALEQTTDPDSGEKVFDRVMRAEDVWFGDHMDSAPDLLFAVNDQGFDVCKYLPSGALFEDAEHTPEMKMGIHSQNGILIMHGKSIRPGAEIDGASLIDIVPTVLHMMGILVPQDMDGEVLARLFEEGFLQKHPIRYSDVESDRKAAGDSWAYTDEQIADLEEKLRELGYL